MKVTFTDAAQKELENFKARQVERLVDAIKERKFVFGDDELEITASDIKEAQDSFRGFSSLDLRYRRTRMFVSLFRVYAVLGVLVSIGGFLYPYIKEIYSTDKMQFAWIAAGIAMTLVSVFMLYGYRERDARYRKFMELEKDLRLREIIQETEKEANK